MCAQPAQNMLLLLCGELVGWHTPCLDGWLVHQWVKQTNTKTKKRGCSTWCSQVVANPSTGQAQTDLTSLIRREVVLSSWYARNQMLIHWSTCWCCSSLMACWFLPKCRSGEVSGGALRRAWPRVRDGQRKGGERKERRGQGHTDDVRGVKRGKGVNSTGHRIGWKTAEES